MIHRDTSRSEENELKESGGMESPSDVRAHAAESCTTTQSERDKDQETERLQWERTMARNERDLACREAELHQEAARRPSIVVRARQSRSGRSAGEGRYTHKPRSSQRYADAGYG